jgi:hypothetical protein
MRALVIVCACLAVLKVWTQDHFYRSAMNTALIDAYRPRAEKTCGREAAKYVGTAHMEWSMSADDAITIGGRVAPVMIWDYDNPLWAVRYRHPHLVITADGPRKLRCSFDLAVGVAFVQAL